MDIILDIRRERSKELEKDLDEAMCLSSKHTRVDE